MRIRQSVSSIGLLLVAGRAHGQQPVAYSLDAAFGGGPHTVHVGQTYYRFRAAGYSRAAMTVLFPQNHRVRATLTVERASTVNGGDDAVCVVEANGSCGATFPDLAGYGVDVGLRARLIPGIDVDVAAGSAAMRGPSEYLIADVAFAFATHAGAVIGVQPQWLQPRSGEHLWWVPITLGIRFD